MPISTLSISPVPSGTANGDTGLLMRKIPNPIGSATVGTFYFGTRLVGFFDQPHGSFFRFEMDVPFGATINGVRLNLISNGSSGINTVLSIGLCKRQENANAWEDSDGVREWTDELHVPWARYNTFVGAQHDPTVWWGNAPAVDLQALANVSGGGQTWSVCEGTFTGGTPGDITGLIAQMQSYLDDAGNEATRGSTEIGSIPILFQIGGLYPGVRNEYQFVHSSDRVNTTLHPVLEIDWSINFAPIVTIESPLDSSEFTEFDTINFQANSIDVEDGDISEDIVWSSDLDGVLHTGAAFSTSELSIGTHVITASSTDSLDEIGTDTVSITITLVEGKICGKSNLTSTIQGKVNLEPTVKGKALVSQTINGQSNMNATVKGKSKLTPTIMGRARIGRC